MVFLSNNREAHASSPGTILDSHVLGETVATLMAGLDSTMDITQQPEQPVYSGICTFERTVATHSENISTASQVSDWLHSAHLTGTTWLSSSYSSLAFYLSTSISSFHPSASPW